MNTRRRTALFGAGAIATISAAALAQNAPLSAWKQAPLYDPQQLPAHRGQLQKFTLTPRDDIDGLILSDGTEVKTSPHLSTRLAYSVRPGDTVTIHGLRAAALPLVEAVSMTNQATSRTVVDAGTPGPVRAFGAAPGASIPGLNEVQGRVRMTFHGPRGEVNGALLEDGTVLRLLPPEADRFADLLQPGQALLAEGDGFANTLGKVLEVRQLGPSRDQRSLVVEPTGPGRDRRLLPPRP